MNSTHFCSAFYHNQWQTTPTSVMKEAEGKGNSALFSHAFTSCFAELHVRSCPDALLQLGWAGICMPLQWEKRDKNIWNVRKPHCELVKLALGISVVTQKYCFVILKDCFYFPASSSPSDRAVTQTQQICLCADIFLQAGKPTGNSRLETEL